MVKGTPKGHTYTIAITMYNANVNILRAVLIYLIADDLLTQG